MIDPLLACKSIVFESKVLSLGLRFVIERLSPIFISFNFSVSSFQNVTLIDPVESGILKLESEIILSDNSFKYFTDDIIRDSEYNLNTLNIDKKIKDFKAIVRRSEMDKRGVEIGIHYNHKLIDVRSNHYY